MILSQATAPLLIFSTVAHQAHAHAHAKQYKSKSKGYKAFPKGGKGHKGSKSCPLSRIPLNEEDFGEPDWETIIELAFPPWATPENGCARLDAVGGSLIPGYEEFPEFESGKWNPCYYTKGFAGLDPSLGGYPTPIDTHYPYEFAAPFLAQPGDGSVHHCGVGENEQNIAQCPKLGNTCGKDCAVISDDYGIGHIPPFVPLAAIKMAYGKCGTRDICSSWFHYETNGCNILKSELDKLVYEYFGSDDKILFAGPKDPSSPTYYRLEYLEKDDQCNEGNCFGPHYCTKEVADDGNIWGDFCPYVHTGEDSGQYRHPHLALAALELWIANQCMPDKCAAEWLDSPNGQGYAAEGAKATSITWAETDDNAFPMAQPAVPYAWPNSGEGDFPGLEDLYPSATLGCVKQAPGLYATEFAGSGKACTA